MRDSFIAGGMQYYIVTLDEDPVMYDVVDAAGSRPLGLRSDGPWETPDQVIAAVEAMDDDE